MNDTASSVAPLSVFLFIDMMISTSDWITRSQMHFCGCWQTISLLMDWFPAEFTFCMILLPPSGTSPPGRPAWEYLSTRHDRTASAPLLLLYSLSVFFLFFPLFFFSVLLSPCEGSLMPSRVRASVWGCRLLSRWKNHCLKITVYFFYWNLTHWPKRFEVWGQTQIKH